MDLGTWTWSIVVLSVVKVFNDSVGKASPSYVAIITISSRGLLARLKSLWNDPLDHAINKLSGRKVSPLIDKIDKLFDILFSKCVIYSCLDTKCPEEQYKTGVM